MDLLYLKCVKLFMRLLSAFTEAESAISKGSFEEWPLLPVNLAFKVLTSSQLFHSRCCHLNLRHQTELIEIAG